MANVVVVGAQWGDEGKGKVVDLLTEFADVVVRFGGGPNAGHTLIVDGHRVVLHLLPSGILRPHKRCILGEGMVVDPAELLDELRTLQERGLCGGETDLLVSERAHLILPHHKALDEARERGAEALGTTRRGIGPAYEDKYGRRGVRVGDLLRPERFRERARASQEEGNRRLVAAGCATLPESVLEDYLRFGDLIARYVTDASRAVSDEISRGRSVLFEGAQGALLDVDHGTYPYVTSSSTIAGGACTGTGVGPTQIHAVVGVCKAYSTRVGGGPFPTELDAEAGAKLREAGAEFGATTGRPRRCGWLDGAALRMASRVNGMTGLAVTKLDVLGGAGKVKVCVGYRVDGKPRDEIPLDPDEIRRAEPVYEALDGWGEETQRMRHLDELPASARRYLRRMEALASVPLHIISLGPERGETIVLRNPFRSQ
jgi:adenylosuccinate synthase